MPVTTVTLKRDMPDRSRVVAKLEIRESGDPDNPRALVGGISPSFSLTGEVYKAHGNHAGSTREKRYRRMLESGGNPGPASEPSSRTAPTGCRLDQN